jgi:hypothetical protein
VIARSEALGPGWTTLVRTRLGDHDGAALYDRATGRVRLCPLGADGIAAPCWSGTWPTGLSHVVPYEVDGAPFLLAYDPATGHVLFVKPEAHGASVLGTATWPTGMPILTPFVRRGRSYMLLYDGSHQSLRYEQLDARGASSTVASWTKQTSYATQIFCHTAGDEAYLVAYSSEWGQMAHWRIDFSSAAGAVHLGTTGYQRGLTLAQLDSPGALTLLAYQPMSGEATVLTFAADHASSTASSPIELAGGAAALVPFGASKDDVLLYDPTSGHADSFALTPAL